MLPMPTLETERLLIRPFAEDDLGAIHQLLDLDLREADFGSEGPQTLNARRQWLHWTILSYAELAKLYQPPYGDRAIILKQDNRLIGACGFVPCLAPFGQLLGFPSTNDRAATHAYSTEFGLFYAVAPAAQRRGYATEASKVLIAYAFDELKLQRIVATTTHANSASIGVMQKVGMRITKNPSLDPPWLQVVGFLENNSGR